jgi:hypothetical protein
MKDFYVWAGGRLLEFDHWHEVRKFKRCCLFKPKAMDQWRMVRKHKWHASQKALMPKEFILALLIAGVQT